MLAKNENKILNLIKYAPTIIVLVIMIILSNLFFLEKEASLNEDINKLKESFLQENKQRIKNEIQSVNDYIVYEKQNSKNALKDELKIRVNEAYNIALFIYEKYKNTHTKEEITTKIKDSLRHFRFNNGMGYFYIYDLNAINILHPFKPQIEGKNMMEFQDKRGNFLSKDILKALKTSDEVYYELYWTKPHDANKQYKKITYNKLFKQMGWFIGTGEYVIDFEERVKARVLSYVNKIQYGKNGYVFIIDYQGNYLSHVNKEYLGLNRINLKNEDGIYVTKLIINKAKLNEGFISYKSTYKPNDLDTSRKVTYVKGLSDWNWAIATGFYLDDLEDSLVKVVKEAKEKNQEILLKIIALCVLLTLLFIAISMYISKVIRFRFLKHKKELIHQVEKNKEKDLLLEKQAKMAAMGEMIQNIAHQWRQPLNAIITFSSSVRFKNELKMLEDKDIDESMDNISNTVRYLSQTIDDFRNFFNPNKSMTYFSFDELFERIFKLYGSQFESKNIELIKDIEYVKINSYENELIQVIINIFNNAKDEFERNENITRRLLFVNIKKEDEKIIIKIKDNAGGIPKNIISKIFDSHFTTKDSSKGTGIGLYMSKQIIKEHLKGSIEVCNETYEFEDEKYYGACFKISLETNLEENVD